MWSVWCQYNSIYNTESYVCVWWLFVYHLYRRMRVLHQFQPNRTTLIAFLFLDYIYNSFIQKQMTFLTILCIQYIWRHPSIPSARLYGVYYATYVRVNDGCSLPSTTSDSEHSTLPRPYQRALEGYEELWTDRIYIIFCWNGKWLREEVLSNRLGRAKYRLNKTVCLGESNAGGIHSALNETKQEPVRKVA